MKIEKIGELIIILSICFIFAITIIAHFPFMQSIVFQSNHSKGQGT